MPDRDELIDRLYRAHMSAANHIAEFGIPCGEREDAVERAWTAVCDLGPDPETESPAPSAASRPARSCNRHKDCDEADRIIMSAEGRPASHCPGPDCGPACQPAPGAGETAPKPAPRCKSCGQALIEGFHYATLRAPAAPPRSAPGAGETAPAAPPRCSLAVKP